MSGSTTSTVSSTGADDAEVKILEARYHYSP